MGLDITTSDNVKAFHIGYLNFIDMRSYFILHYGTESYEIYHKILNAVLNDSYEVDMLYHKLFKQIGDLKILIGQSDCDGELTSDECKKLRSCLFVDEERIKSALAKNKEYCDRMIKLMYEFVGLITYCAEHNDVKLIFN